ncbi:CvpA family protein [bacterium 1XD21-13]|nr:CvpA family protein [bacterium 1XD21-13]
MNWLIFAVVGFLILSAGDGHRKGFIKKSVGIVSIALTLFLTSAVSSYIMTFLKEKTKMHHVLQNTVASGDTELLETFRMIGLEDMVSGYLADIILKVAAFLITFFLVSVLIQGIVFSLGIVAKLPVLHGLNKTAGMLLGLGEGILFVWIFFFVVTVCAGTKLGGTLLWMIADSDLLAWIYRKNLLLLLL